MNEAVPGQTSERSLKGLSGQRSPVVALYRVSTQRQGRSGLGLDAQRAAVQDYLRSGSWSLIDELVEVETGTGRRQRPVLAQAVDRCRITGATLIIAKLDRLARNVAFVSSLMESGVDFVALDCPQANRFTVHVLAAVAEHEARLISERTRAALAAAKCRGRRLGTPANLRRADEGRTRGAAAVREQADERARGLEATVCGLAPGRSLRELADAMNQQHIKTPRPGGRWHARSVGRLLARIGIVRGADPQAPALVGN